MGVLAPPRTLDVTAPQQVQYCIPMWLRDEQIKLSMARIQARITPPTQPQTEPIALVCYGSSLKETWEQVRDFKYVMSCSGSHKFLLDHGIVPTYHVDVDPRPHKATLLGQPHPDVEYLIASTCHPALFDLLEGYNVKLWHVFDAADDAIRTLPFGEWALTGGCSVGLRTMTVARFLGFCDQHIFGMDGLGKHAAAHPNEPPQYDTCEYNGVTYETTASFLEAARGTFHELNQMPDVRATFYGEGLVQAMARDYVPDYSGPKKGLIGIVKDPLISEAYRALNAQLHRENLAYGVGGENHAETVLKIAESVKTKNILDYGCGKGRLGKAIPWQIAEYDPCISGKEQSPKPADVVVCTDVLEHIEPERLYFVLADLQRCVRQVGYFVVYTQAAQKTLPDGRNTHLIQRDPQWWRVQLQRYFKIGLMRETQQTATFVVGPKVGRPKAPLQRASAVASVAPAHAGATP